MVLYERGEGAEIAMPSDKYAGDHFVDGEGTERDFVRHHVGHVDTLFKEGDGGSDDASREHEEMVGSVPISRMIFEDL